MSLIEHRGDKGLFLIETDTILKDTNPIEAFKALLNQAQREPYFLPVIYSTQKYVPESMIPFHGSPNFVRI